MIKKRLLQHESIPVLLRFLVLLYY